MVYINQSNFYSANISGEARLSGAHFHSKNARKRSASIPISISKKLFESHLRL